MNIFLTSIATLILTISFSCKALDDFDLMKYGQDVSLETKRTDVIVKMVFYKDEEAINDEFIKINGGIEQLGKEFNGVRGFAMVNDTTDVCYIHMMEANIWDDRENMAILGHEMYHCLLADHKEHGEGFVVIATEEAEVSNEPSIADLLKEEAKLEIELLYHECLNWDPKIFEYPPSGCSKLNFEK
jgi:hypothetical protein